MHPQDRRESTSEHLRRHEGSVPRQPARVYPDFPYHLSVVSICFNFRFDGQGQRETPVAGARGIVRIIMLRASSRRSPRTTRPRSSSRKSSTLHVFLGLVWGPRQQAQRPRQPHLPRHARPSAPPSAWTSASTTRLDSCSVPSAVGTSTQASGACPSRKDLSRPAPAGRAPLRSSACPTGGEARARGAPQAWRAGPRRGGARSRARAWR